MVIASISHEEATEIVVDSSNVQGKFEIVPFSKTKSVLKIMCTVCTLYLLIFALSFVVFVFLQTLMHLEAIQRLLSSCSSIDENSNSTSRSFGPDVRMNRLGDPGFNDDYFNLVVNYGPRFNHTYNSSLQHDAVGLASSNNSTATDHGGL